MNSKIDTKNLSDTYRTAIVCELERVLKNPPIAHGTYTLELFFRDWQVQRFTVSQTTSTLLTVP